MDLLENPFAKLDEKGDPLIPTATLQIYQEINEYLKGEENGNVFRASAATMCVRRRWYQRKGFKGSPLTPRKIINFLLGDLSERTLLYFIKRSCVGDGKIYSEVLFGDTLGSIKFQGKDIELYKQQTLSFKLNDLTITGHADGFGKRNVDGKYELIEIKSAADYGFKEFQENGPGDYVKQSHALMLTDEARELDIKSVRFYYLRKSTGHTWDKVVHYDEKIADIVKKEFLISNQEEIPDAPYDFVYTKQGYKTIPWQCQYCSYLEHCKPGFKMSWKKDMFGTQKPIYIYEDNVCNSKNNQANQNLVGTF